MKMEQTECSETSAYKFQTPGIHPKESIQQYYTTYHCVTIAYSIQYINMLYRFVA